jgi:hypothetical protein
MQVEPVIGKRCRYPECTVIPAPLASEARGRDQGRDPVTLTRMMRIRWRSIGAAAVHAASAPITTSWGG